MSAIFEVTISAAVLIGTAACVAVGWHLGSRVAEVADGWVDPPENKLRRQAEAAAAAMKTMAGGR